MKIEFYKSVHKLWDGFYFTWVRYKIDGKIYIFATIGTTKKIAETGALDLLFQYLRKERFNES